MIAAALLLAAASPDAIVGTWEGTSLCQVRPSPCHDEHVVYRISAVQPLHYRIDAYKLVAGQEDFMGAIDVTLDSSGRELDGPVISGGQVRARVHFALNGSRLTGRMTGTDGTLYRLIDVTKR